MDSFIKKILEKIGIGGGSEESVLGIDIGSSAIKVVQAKNEKGVAVLETYGELALGPYDGKEVGEAVRLSSNIQSKALSDLLEEADVTTENCGLSIPYSSSLVSFIEVPKVGEQELSEMIPIEARKYVPVPISEVMLDWFIVSEGPDNKRNNKSKGKDKIDVMLVAIHNDNLEEYMSTMEKVNLSPSFYEIEAFSTVRSVLSQGVKAVMIMDIGTTMTKLYMVERGVVKYSHSINKGGQEMTESLSRALGITKAEAEKRKREVGLNEEGQGPNDTGYMEATLDYILNETNKALIKYQKENNKNVTKVFLTGGGSLLKGLQDKAEDSLDAEVLMGDPFAKLQSPAFLEDTLKEAGPEFAVAIGVALRKLQEL